MITASIVLFNTPEYQIKEILESVINSSCIDRLYIIDNSNVNHINKISTTKKR